MRCKIPGLQGGKWEASGGNGIGPKNPGTRMIFIHPLATFVQHPPLLSNYFPFFPNSKLGNTGSARNSPLEMGLIYCLPHPDQERALKHLKKPQKCSFPGISAPGSVLLGDNPRVWLISFLVFPHLSCTFQERLEQTELGGFWGPSGPMNPTGNGPKIPRIPGESIFLTSLLFMVPISRSFLPFFFQLLGSIPFSRLQNPTTSKRFSHHFSQSLTFSP